MTDFSSRPGCICVAYSDGDPNCPVCHPIAFTATQLNAQNLAHAIEATDSTLTQPLPRTDPQTRDLMIEWLRAQADEDTKRDIYQQAEDQYQVSRATTTRIAKDIGALVSPSRFTRYFRVGPGKFDMRTVIEVKYNTYDTSRPHITVVELEIP